MANAKQRREICLIAPIGVDVNAVVSALERALKIVNYDPNPIRVTDIFSDMPSDLFDLDYSDKFERYIKYIKAGDDL